MTIFVDHLQKYGTKGEWAHMWSDTNDMTELHAFAATLGLKRSWLHESHGISGAFPHYDLTPNKRSLAVSKGAVEMSLREWVKPRMPKAESEDY